MNANIIVNSGPTRSFSFPCLEWHFFADPKPNPIDQRLTNEMGCGTPVGPNVITVINTCTVGRLMGLC